MEWMLAFLIILKSYCRKVNVKILNINKIKEMYIMLRLTTLEKKDYETIVQWNSDKDEAFLYQWAGKVAYSYPLTSEQIRDRQRTGSVSIFKIEKDNQMVGTVEVTVPDTSYASVRFGRLLIGDTYRGCGYGSQAIALVEKLAFEDYGVRYLELGVFEFNSGAKKLYERLGFDVVGVKRDDMDSKWDSYTMRKAKP